MSEIVQLDFPVAITKPVGFDKAQHYTLLYLLHGYSLDYRQWQAIIDLQSLADKHNMVIVCPDGGRTFFMDSCLEDGIQYESFFFEELVPYIHSQYSITKDQVFISGASMGGFGALHLMLRRPDYFTAAGSSSGTASFGHDFWQTISFNVFGSDVITRDMEQILGHWPDASGNWHKYSLINRIREFEIAEKPMIIDCGMGDPVFAMNEQLIDALGHIENITTEKKTGDHSFTYWSKTINMHLAFFDSLKNIHSKYDVYTNHRRNRHPGPDGH